MDQSNRETIERRHLAQRRTTNSRGEALRAAQELIVLAPEFHATNLNSKTAKRRPQESSTASLGRPYKAIVYIMLEGAG